MPKRLRHHLEHDPAILNAALVLFLCAIERTLRHHSPDASAQSRLGAVVFIHRFGALLNPHLHFHCVAVDGAFDTGTSGGVAFHEASGLDTSAITVVQTTVRRRLLRAAQRRGLLSEDDAKAMADWAHGGGFSVDAEVRIEANDRPGLERLLRYCARPASPVTCPRATPKRDAGAPSACAETAGASDPRCDFRAPLRGAPPRRHRHRYVGVLAPNAPLRAAVTALAQPEAEERLATSEGQPAAPDDDSDEPLHRKAARLVRAMLITRIYEVFPLACPPCGGQMRIVVFMTEGAAIREILAHLGEPTSPPRLLPARGPPLWEMADAGQGEYDPQAQPAPDCEFDQRIAW